MTLKVISVFETFQLYSLENIARVGYSVFACGLESMYESTLKMRDVLYKRDDILWDTDVAAADHWQQVMYNSAVFDDVVRVSWSFSYCKRFHTYNDIRSSLQHFNWCRASRGPSAIAELVVAILWDDCSSLQWRSANCWLVRCWSIQAKVTSWYSLLAAWHSGRMSVFSRQTFPVLRLTDNHLCEWTVRYRSAN